MSRFFFSCAVIGAICGLVGGLMDSAVSGRTLAKSATTTSDHKTVLIVWSLFKNAFPSLAGRGTRDRTSIHAPRGHPRPRLQGVSRPRGGLIRVATGARIRHLVLVGHRRCDELERVAPHVDIRNRLRDLRHVTRDAFAATASPLMMGMGLEGRPMR